ncbi:androgen-dependent TFPI-regulating protein-like [Anticarsia gemmatalis]|uniref:androgen-dependent TFPI-regulating protein-like n=1 Tax=Anticarsia gemmatalis TaxID=129554 RepID=UPI003F765498
MMEQPGLFRSHLPNPIYLRMLGYTTTLIVHLTNAVYLIELYQGDILKDPEIYYFQKYQLRFLTIWNVYTQGIYAALGLSCDVLTLANEGKDSSLLRTLRSIRDPMFSAIVLPYTSAVFTIFWTLHLWDPNLVLPPSIINTLPSLSNHVLHTFVLPFMLWEVAFRPRKVPSSHLFNLVVVLTHAVLFIGTLFYTQYDTGRFPYPILNAIDGTPYLYIFLSTCVVWLLTSYRAQWYVTEYLWGSKAKKEL